MPTTVDLLKASAVTQIQTDLQNTVAASAAAALNSQNAAAASATTALNAISGAFKGALAGASVPATSTAAGDTYRITSAGTSQSKTWAVGDAAIYNGTSGQWTQLTGFYSGATSYTETGDSYRESGSFIWSDGNTANRAQLQLPGARGNLATSTTATWIGWVDVPTANLSATGGIFAIAGVATPSGSDSNSLVTSLLTDGSLRIDQRGASGGNDFRRFAWSSFRSTYSGQRIWLEVRFTSGTSNPVVRVNGVDISASFTASSANSVPQWLDAALVASYLITGYSWGSGTAPLGCWLNTLLTDAESEAWRITGRPPFWVAAGGSQISLITGDDSTFASDTAFWTKIGTATISGGAANLGTSSSTAIYRDNFLVPGQRYRATAVVTSGTGLFLGWSATPDINLNVTGAGTFSVEFTAGGASIPARLGIYSTGSVVLDSFTIRPIGALSLPQVQPGSNNILDTTFIGGNDAMLVGMLGISLTDGAQSEAQLDQRVSARAGYILCDGITSNRAQVQIPGARGNLAGAPSASWVGWVEVPTVAWGTGSNASTIACIVSRSDQSPNNGTYNLHILGGADGLYITQMGATTSDYRGFNWTSAFRAMYAGQRIWLEVRFSFGTTNPVVRVNGADISSMFTATTGGSSPNWLDASLLSNFFLTGYQWLDRISPQGSWINAHLTNAESDSWRITGRPPFWVFRGGSAAPLYTSDFSTTVDGWSGGTQVASVDSIGGQNDTLELTGANAYAMITRNLPRTVLQGERLRIALQVYRPSGTTSIQWIGLRNSDNSFLFNNAATAVQIPNANTWTDVIVEGIAARTVFGIGLSTNTSGGAGGALATGEKLYFKNIQLLGTGAMSLPLVQSGSASILDATLIGGNDAILIGHTGYSVFDSGLTEAAQDQKTLSRQSAPYVWCDGATTNRAMLQYPGTRGNFAGAPLASWVGWVDVPATNPSANAFIFAVSNSATPSEGEANSIVLLIRSDGSMRLRANGVVALADARWREWSTFRTIFSGQRIWLEVRFTQPLAFPTVRINGTDVTRCFGAADTTQGTPPNSWLAATLATGTQLTGYNWVVGIAPLGCWINGHLTDADSEAWRLTGRAPQWVVQGGNAGTSLLTDSSRNGVFTAVATDWGSFGSATATLNTGTQKLDVSVSAATGGCRLGHSGSPFNVALGGRGATIRFTLSNVVGQTVQVVNSSGGGVWQTFLQNCTNGTYYITLPDLQNNGSGAPQLAFYMNGAGSFTLDDFEVYACGAISLLRPQVIPVADDFTMLGGNPARLLGMRGVSDDKWWRFVVDVDTSSTGNKQVLQGAVFEFPDRQVLDSIEQKLVGTPTFSIGDGTTATRYTASAAPGAGRTRATLASPFPADSGKTGLYVNVTVTGGTAERFTFAGHQTD